MFTYKHVSPEFTSFYDAIRWKKVPRDQAQPLAMILECGAGSRARASTQLGPGSGKLQVRISSVI
jgi:hypothetical protein